MILLAMLIGCPATPADDTGSPPSYVGFQLAPSYLVVQPGDCLHTELLWSLDEPPDPTRVEVEGPPGMRFEVEGTGFRACGGAQETEGEVRMRLVGEGELQYAGDAVVIKPNPRDDDPVEPSLIRGRAPWPGRIWWSDDGTHFLATSERRGVLDVYDASTALRVDTHLVHSPYAAPIDAERVAVSLPGDRVAVYHLGERSYETWYDALRLVRLNGWFAYEVPRIREGTGELPILGAGGGRIGSKAYQRGGPGCTNSVLDYGGPYDRIELSRASDGPPAGLLVDIGLTGAEFGGLPSGVGPPRRQWMALSDDGSKAIFGPWDCWALGNTVVDLDAGTAQKCGSDLAASWVHEPVLAPDGSAMVTFAGGGAIEITDTQDCEVLGTTGVGTGEHVGLAVRPDGMEIAVAWTGNPGDDLTTRPVHLDRYDRQGNLVASHEVDARFLAVDTQQYQAHRIAYSPDGERIALIAADGRPAVVELDGGDVVQSMPFDWGTAELLPDPDRVLVQADEWATTDLMLVDVHTQEILRSHPLPLTLHGVLEDGSYVLYHPGALTYTRVDGQTGEESAHDGSLDDAWDSQGSSSDDGGTTCSVVDDTVCINATCKDAESLFGISSAHAQSCIPLADGVIAISSQWGIWQWNGVSEEAVFFAHAPGDGILTATLHRFGDNHIAVRNRTHLMHWER